MWHTENRGTGLSNTVTNNCHFASFEEVGGATCNIKNVLILPLSPISLLLATESNFKIFFFFQILTVS